MTRRALVVCPGRGAYARDTLGILANRSPAAWAVVAACDGYRAGLGQPTISELDSADRFQGALHTAGEHASLLTFACSMADLAELDRDAYEIVGVTGNSMGWYTALAAAGALSLGDAIRLVDTMGSYQAGNVIGGQLLYPVWDADWRPSAELAEAVETALAEVHALGHAAHHSIRLGGFAVLAGDRSGVRELLARLPPVERGARRFPVQLPRHSAFHTPLMADTAARAGVELADLDFRRPAVPLVDGLGRVHTRLSASTADLAHYTWGAQVSDVFDFDAAFVTALHHCAPDVVVLLGPGNALGGPCARLVCDIGWSGLRSRAALGERQAAQPLLASFGVPEQAAALT